MACNAGQRFQDQLDKAVEARAEFEARAKGGPALMEAQIKESGALQRRSVHVNDCAECWVNPPRRRRAALTFAGLMAAG